MAKKRKKEVKKQEEYEFVPPSFDEKEFLKKEIRDTKTLLFTVGYAVLFGVAAGVISYASNALVGAAFALGIVGIFSLKYVYPLIRVDTSEFKKKNWAGSVAWFFLTFLAIWVLMFNVPLSDHADPDITKVIVWVEKPGNITGIEYKYVKMEGDYVWVPMFGETLEEMIHASADYRINLTANVADNGKLSSVSIKIGSMSEFVPMTYEGDNRYAYSFNGTSLPAYSSSGNISFSILAVDAEGNEFELMPARPIPFS